MANSNCNTSVATVGDAMSDEQKEALKSAPVAAPESDRPVLQVSQTVDRERLEKRILDVVNPPEGAEEQSVEHEPTFNERMIGNIAQQFSPSMSVIEASADAREALAHISTLGNEIEGTGVSRLTIDLANIGYHEVTRKPKPGLMASPEMAKDLVSLVKGRKLFGEPVAEKDQSSLLGIKNTTTGETKSDPRFVVENISPYVGKIASYINDAAMRACLLLIPHISSVEIGYIRKEQCSGKRFSRNMTFLRKDQLTGDVSEYYSAVCIPTRVVIPCSYMSRFDAVAKENVLDPADASTEETLRYLNGDWAFALYSHHFGNAELAYDVVAKGSKFPTGMLLRAPKEPRVAVTGTSSAEPTTLDQAKKIIANQRTELRKTAQGSLSADLVNPRLIDGLGALTTALKDVTGTPAITPRLEEALGKLFVTFMRHRVAKYRDKPILDHTGYWLGEAKTLLDSNIKWDDKNGNFLWMNDMGNTMNVIPSITEDEAAIKAA